MNPDRQSRSSMDPLPRSVKVRSTCNACQQAKIRCSHEKPSCRRCQKHRIECIYSMSRRLGRPAKKRESTHDSQSLSQEPSTFPRHQPSRRVRSPKKSKVKEESVPDSLNEGHFHGPAEKTALDKGLLDDSIIDDIAIEDTGLQSSSFLDPGEASPFPGPSHIPSSCAYDIANVPPPKASDTIDLSPDSWLQDLVPIQPPEIGSDRNLMHAMGANNINSDGVFPVIPMEIKDLPCSMGVTISSPRLQEQPMMTGCDATDRVLPSLNGDRSDCTQAMASVPPSYVEDPHHDLLVWPQALSPSMEAFPVRQPAKMKPVEFLAPSKAPRRGHEYNHQSDDHRIDPHILIATAARQYQCQCHEQAVHELMQMNLLVSRTGSIVTIDSILSCQRVLQQLTDTVLQCGVCSKTMVNLLIVVVVSIDSLVTTLEAITSVENGLVDGLFCEHPNSRIQENRPEGSSSGRRHKGDGMHFKAQVEACPLLVGGFCVPADEKFTFVQQVLHARLCGLLGTVRRIQFFTQEVHTISASQGKLIMMMETDRKLRLIMMKMRMLTRR
ncbi:hypothetical protein EYZ11_001968 [Aspergillus tanneri]|uniref:Zn(2)-C6 fungal-type domain-containing protein n=1 Tax=Aspergillus tanneri TaxID=1220188 RepID=A0A4S3JTH7_9EURO|nr:uncharacterized protein ATNIH1004_004192 [Aspergillus tanneri]KAA8648307.1 hypothetical protein ATNIH1004_004192 [Aspergillus tanneri]THC98538.1 hypothetical protein EYZ11_001968 [Aspergillus tanneri]